MPKIGGETQPIEKLKSSFESAEWTLNQLDKHFSNSQFILGDKFSLADCSLGVQVATLHETLLSSKDRWPNVFSYKNRITSRPSWADANGSAIWDQ